MSDQASAAFSDLMVRVRHLVGTGERRVLIGVTGSPGAGKSTLVEALAAALHRLGRSSRKGAPDTFDAHGYLSLLRRLRADEPAVVYAPAFERDLEQPVAGAIPVPATARLVLTEGNYLLLDADPWPAIAAELDEVWYCALDDETRRTGLVARHVAFGKDPDIADRWVDDVDERNAGLITASQARAHLIVPSGALERVGVPQTDEPSTG